MKGLSIQINLFCDEQENLEEIKKLINQVLNDRLHSVKYDSFAPSLNKAGSRKLVREFLRKRDGENCCWCGEQMNFNASGETPDIPTFEHLTRKVEGGTNEIENLKLAHKKCNNERHSKNSTYDRNLDRIVKEAKERGETELSFEFIKITLNLEDFQVKSWARQFKNIKVTDRGILIDERF